MSIILNLNQSQSMSGLGTCTWTAPAAMPITVSCESTIPNNSGLSIVINQNGTPVATFNDPAATQPSLGASANIICAATDVITVVLSSSNAVDGLPNSVKSTVNLFQSF